ncbi:unnamed protein product, partial [Thlaspi arvense]
ALKPIAFFPRDIIVEKMSNRRSRQSSSAPRISDDQMIDLVTKLRQILPEIGQRRRSDQLTTSASVCLSFWNPSMKIALKPPLLEVYSCNL